MGSVPSTNVSVVCFHLYRTEEIGGLFPAKRLVALAPGVLVLVFSDWYYSVYLYMPASQKFVLLPVMRYSIMQQKGLKEAVAMEP